MFKLKLSQYFVNHMFYCQLITANVVINLPHRKEVRFKVNNK